MRNLNFAIHLVKLLADSRSLNGVTNHRSVLGTDFWRRAICTEVKPLRLTRDAVFSKLLSARFLVHFSEESLEPLVLPMQSQNFRKCGEHWLVFLAALSRMFGLSHPGNVRVTSK